MPPGREAAPRRKVAFTELARPGVGRAIVAASLGGTVVLTVTSLAAAVAPRTLDVPALVIDLGMFFAGITIFVWAYLVAIGRSRISEVALGGVFGLAGSTPSAVRVRLLGSLAVELVVVFATAAARPYTTLAFGILAPMWALALAGLWGARHGAFPPRQDPRGARRTR